MPYKSPVFDDISQLFTSATDCFAGVSEEAKSVLYARLEKHLIEMDFVRREEINRIEERLAEALQKIELQNLEIEKLKKNSTKRKSN